MLQLQGRDEQGLERNQIRQTLVLFQPADLRFAVANRDGKFKLGEPLAAAQIFEQITKGREAFGCYGLGGHVPSVNSVRLG